MENKFNFKSQPSTLREQSERLLKLGLKKETADMTIDCKYMGNNYDGVVVFEEAPAAYPPMLSRDFPSWSLDRLREMINRSGVTISFVERDTSIIVERYGVFQNMCEIWNNVYDNICDGIEWLIKEGYFNKEYLA